jgi:hypothetical protein
MCAGKLFSRSLLDGAPLPIVATCQSVSARAPDRSDAGADVEDDAVDGADGPLLSDGSPDAALDSGLGDVTVEAPSDSADVELDTSTE